MIDPNTLSPTAPSRSSGTEVSHDGRFVAYGIAAAGSDWNEWKVRDLASGKDLPDRLKWIKFSEAEWGPDDQGFFYGRFPEPKPGQDLKGANYDQKVYYHRLGTLQQDDVLVWEDPEHKEWRAIPTVTDDGKYLILTIEKGTDNKYRILYRPLDQPDAEAGPPGRRLRRGLHLHRQRRPGLLVSHRQERPARQGRRDRHPQAGARATGST